MTSTRNTAQRREVIEALARVKEFVSAQDLHALIVKSGGQIALATVYTQLKRLVESGEVDAVMSERGESLYRRCVVDAHHHHLACRVCGAIVEVDTPELEGWTNAIAEKFGYRDLRHVLELSGICAQCHARAH
ncbi:MAG: Fur family transcriptional regulator [Acidimicrobiales bacterium]